MKKILIINGANLNNLGKRDNNIYGAKTLEQINADLKEKFKSKAELTFFQSNIEGEIVDEIQKADSNFNACIINAGGYSHTSVVIRDAVADSKIDFVEVHISNIYNREKFRNESLLSSVCKGCIIGLGTIGYELAIQSLLYE